jgi:hypothetical protein
MACSGSLRHATGERHAVWVVLRLVVRVIMGESLCPAQLGLELHGDDGLG